jgi:tetratricopeptide (TPR) repeat protein
MTPEETREAGRELFRTKQFALALPLLHSAAKTFPDDESLWRDLVSSALRSEQNIYAAELAREGLGAHPNSDWLWRHLGNALTLNDDLPAAEDALDNARRLNPRSDWLWRYFAELHHKQQRPEKEIEALESLRELGAANEFDLNQLGIAYQQFGNFAKALESYRRAVAAGSDCEPFFNMALVYNLPEVSQKTDAADAYHRALSRKPDDAGSKKQLADVKQQVKPLVKQACAAARHLNQADQPYERYLNPYEAFQIEVGPEGEAPDAKAIQRAKKKLLHEIELNRGKVSWLGDCSLDASRVHELDRELLDPDKARYHRQIFQNKLLLRFLTHGHIEHFYYSDKHVPLATLDQLDKEPAFRSFLSKPFAAQYNAVLTRAIDLQLLPVIEVLLSGRRWVDMEDDDLCFEGACKRLGNVAELIAVKVIEVQRRAAPLPDIQAFMRQHSLPDLFNVLPSAHFKSYREAVITEIRNLAAFSYNQYHDVRQLKGLLSLCMQFKYPGVELAEVLQKDFERAEYIASQQGRVRQSSPASEDDSAPAIVGKILGGVLSLIMVVGYIGSCSSRRTAPNLGTSVANWYLDEQAKKAREERQQQERMGAWQQQFGGEPRPAPDAGRDHGKNAPSVRDMLDEFLRNHEFNQRLRRMERMGRWTMTFNTRDGEDYVKQLQSLGAILAIEVPGEPGKATVYRDLTSPAEGEVEDINEIESMWWIDDKHESVIGLCAALRIKPEPQRVIVFLPPRQEEKLLELELEFAGKKEEEINETIFELKNRGKGRYEPVVVRQK